jgi:ComF family protein
VVNQGFFTDSCPFCQRLALKFDAAVTLGGYHQGLRDIVLRMKRPTHDALTVAMGRLLYQRRCREFSNYPLDMVVPIPMYWWRRLRRGANNPDVLARCLGESLAIPVHRRLLVRHVNTKPQADLPRSQRLVNVRGAFRLRNPDRVQNANILLVDDVLTTGATCSEAAKILKQAGAASVVVAVIARTQRE